MMRKLLHKWHEALGDMSYIFLEELRSVFTDQGVLIFFILVPLGYPLLYSWLYNNEAVKDVPTVFVDDSHSFLSREFIRHADATEGIRVVNVISSMSEARACQAQGESHGIVYIPSDFEQRVRKGEQTQVTFFADLSGMLYYKAIFSSLTDVSLDMGTEIQIAKLPFSTRRDAELSTAPLHYDGIALFNPTGGYGSFLLPAVLMLILQQTLLLGIGMSAGTARENNRWRELVPVKRHYGGVFRIVIGKALCYFLIYLVMATWNLLAVPHMFHFIQLADWLDIAVIAVPYLLACTFFGMMFSGLVRYRENIILLVLFTSVPFLFLSGASWPASAMSGLWKGVSWLFPSTFGIGAYVKLASLGASLHDVGFEYNFLWLHTILYFFGAVFVYWRQITRSRAHALHRHRYMELRRRAREMEGVDCNAGDV